MAALLRRPVAADTGALLLTIVAVQGLVPLAQLGAAALLPPETFGALRTAESVLGVALLLGALGMPTLAITGSARLTSLGERATLARRVVAVAAGSSLVALALLELGAAQLAAEPGATRLLRWLAPVVVIGALGRTALGFAQGVRRLRPLAMATLTAAVPALLLVLALTAWRGIGGWVVGRLVGEGLLLVAATSVVRDLIATAPSPLASSELAPTRLAGAGATIAASLLARGAIDAVALVAAGHGGVGARALGHLGLGTLLVTGLLLAPVALYAATLPRLVVRRDDRAAATHAFGRMALAGTGLAAAGASALALAGPLALRALGPGYADAGGVLLAVLAAAPLRALTGAGGNLLLAQHRVVAALALNAASLVLLGGAVFVASRVAGGQGAAVALLAVEAITAGLVTLVAWKVAGRGGAHDRGNVEGLA